MSTFYSAKDSHSGNLCGHRHRSLRTALSCSYHMQSSANAVFADESWDGSVVAIENCEERRLTESEEQERVNYGKNWGVE